MLTKKNFHRCMTMYAACCTHTHTQHTTHTHTQQTHAHALLRVTQLSCKFVDADDWHSTENKAKMAKGIPLTDEVIG